MAELIKQAAKDTWRNRGNPIAIVRHSGDRLSELAEAISSWRSERSALTTLGIGLPVPNEFFSTRLALEGSDPGELAVQIALFVHHLPALTALIAEEGLADGGAVTVCSCSCVMIGRYWYRGMIVTRVGFSSARSN